MLLIYFKRNTLRKSKKTKQTKANLTLELDSFFVLIVKKRLKFLQTQKEKLYYRQLAHIFPLKLFPGLITPK